MGQNQLLLIILGMIIVGLAIYVSLTMFGANAEESTRNAMINDLSTFANGARIWYERPSTQGGGDKSFSSLTAGQIGLRENENARYYISSASGDLCLIEGVGKIVASNGDSVQIRVRVTPVRNAIEILN